MKEKRKQRGEGQKQIVKYGEEYYGKAEKFVGEKKPKQVIVRKRTCSNKTKTKQNQKSSKT